MRTVGEPVARKELCTTRAIVCVYEERRQGKEACWIGEGGSLGLVSGGVTVLLTRHIGLGKANHRTLHESSAQTPVVSSGGLVLRLRIHDRQDFSRSAALHW